MSSLLLRFGLYTLIAILGLHVIAATSPDSAVASFIESDELLIHKTVGLSIMLIIAGVVVRLLERGATKVTKNRCRVCRAAIPVGAIYCREHLRSILQEEDERTHMTRTRIR